MSSTASTALPLNEIVFDIGRAAPSANPLGILAERYRVCFGKDADDGVSLARLRSDIAALTTPNQHCATLSESEAFDLVVSAFSLSATRFVVQKIFSVWRRDAEVSKAARQSSSFRIARIESELSAAEQLLLQCVRSLRSTPEEPQAREGRDAVTGALSACERCASDLRETVSAALIALVSQDGVFSSDETFRVLSDDELFSASRIVALLSRPDLARPAAALLSAVGL